MLHHIHSYSHFLAISFHSFTYPLQPFLYLFAAFFLWRPLKATTQNQNTDVSQKKKKKKKILLHWDKKNMLVLLQVASLQEGVSEREKGNISRLFVARVTSTEENYVHFKHDPQSILNYLLSLSSSLQNTRRYFLLILLQAIYFHGERVTSEKFFNLHKYL